MAKERSSKSLSLKRVKSLRKGRTQVRLVLFDKTLKRFNFFYFFRFSPFFGIAALKNSQRTPPARDERTHVEV